MGVNLEYISIWKRLKRDNLGNISVVLVEMGVSIFEVWKWLWEENDIEMLGSLVNGWLDSDLFMCFVFLILEWMEEWLKKVWYEFFFLLVGRKWKR